MRGLPAAARSSLTLLATLALVACGSGIRQVSPAPDVARSSLAGTWTIDDDVLRLSATLADAPAEEFADEKVAIHAAAAGPGVLTFHGRTFRDLECTLWRSKGRTRARSVPGDKHLFGIRCALEDDSVSLLMADYIDEDGAHPDRFVTEVYLTVKDAPELDPWTTALTRR
jgi:hypothetical protein